MSSVIDSLVVILGLDASKFEKGSKDARESFKKTTEELQRSGKGIEDAGAKMADALGKVAREAMAMFAVFTGAASLKGFVAELATADSALGRLAANLGTTPQVLSAWGMAAEQVGGNAQAAMGSIKALSDRLQALHILGEQLPNELYVLQARGGVTIDNEHGSDKALLDIAQNIQNVSAKEGRPQAAFLAQRAGINLDLVNAILDKGPALREELERLKRISADPRDVKAAAALQEAWVNLKNEATDLGRKIQTDLTPAIKEILKGIQEWISTNKDDIKKPFVEFGDYLRGDGGKEIKQFFKDVQWLTHEIAEALKTAAGYAKMLPGWVDKAGEAGTSAREYLLTPSETDRKVANWINRQFGWPETPAPLGGSSPSSGAPGNPILRRRPPSAPAAGGIEGSTTPTTPSSAPTAPLSSISSSGGLDRSRFAAELAANPALREKVMAISAGENLDPTSNLAVMETMMNRASMMGTHLAKEGRTTGEGGYYAGYNPSALNRAKTRAMIEANLEKALQGSNVSNYATDNASQAWGWRRMHNGFYTMDSTYGNEYFGHPTGPGARGMREYPKWRAAAERQAAEAGNAPLYGAGSLAAFSGLTAGSRLAAGGSSTSSVSNSNSELNIHGPISVYTQAQDADQMARDLRPALQRYNLAAPANDGAN